MLPGMAYVMLGRCECLQDVFITLGKEENTAPPPIKRNKLSKQKRPIKKDFDTSKIKCSSAAKEENEALKARSKDRQKKINAFFEDEGVLVGFINIRSLRLHWQDFVTDENFKCCQLIGLCETWLHMDEEITHFNYDTETVNVGRGQGIATFNNIQAKVVFKFGSQTLSIVALQFNNWLVVFMYASQGVNYNNLTMQLTEVFCHATDYVMVVGDMNWDYLRQRNAMKVYFQQNGFHQIIENPTHEEGGLLDHVYVRTKESVVVACQRAKYYSDHDAIFIRINKE